jgi:hypothetical protein
VLSRQCRERRVPDAATRTVDWRFTAADARIKLKRLYVYNGHNH